jgi:hypothetical protein
MSRSTQIVRRRRLARMQSREQMKNARAGMTDSFEETDSMRREDDRRRAGMKKIQRPSVVDLHRSLGGNEGREREIIPTFLRPGGPFSLLRNGFARDGEREGGRAAALFPKGRSSSREEGEEGEKEGGGPATPFEGGTSAVRPMKPIFLLLF